MQCIIKSRILTALVALIFVQGCNDSEFKGSGSKSTVVTAKTENANNNGTDKKVDNDASNNSDSENIENIASSELAEGEDLSNTEDDSALDDIESNDGVVQATPTPTPVPSPTPIPAEDVLLIEPSSPGASVFGVDGSLQARLNVMTGVIEITGATLGRKDSNICQDSSTVIFSANVVTENGAKVAGSVTLTQRFNGCGGTISSGTLPGKWGDAKEIVSASLNKISIVGGNAISSASISFPYVHFNFDCNSCGDDRWGGGKFDFNMRLKN